MLNSANDDDDNDVSSAQWVNDHTVVLTRRCMFKPPTGVDFLDGKRPMDQDRNSINDDNINHDYRKINNGKSNQVDYFVDDIVKPVFRLTLNIFSVEGKKKTVVTSFPRKLQNDFEKL